jgi:hypothetical protein
MGLIMSQTASDSLLSEPHNCLIVGFGVEVGVGVEVEVGAATGVKVGFGAALIATPLFHTNRVPDLTQVYFFPPEIEVAPAFVHFTPAFGAATAGPAANKRTPIIKGETICCPRRISKVKPPGWSFTTLYLINLLPTYKKPLDIDIHRATVIA